MQVLPSGQLESDLANVIIGCGKQVTLLLAGGSQLARVPKMINTFHSLQVPIGKLSISLIDERYSLEPEHPGSNFFQLKQIPGFLELEHNGAQLLPVLEKNRSLSQAGEKLNQLLEAECNDDSKLTIAVVGVGANGHMMGILPHDPKFGAIFYGASAVGYEADKIGAAPDDYRLRVTTTFEGLAKVDKVLVFAIGERKRTALQAIVAKREVASLAEVAGCPALYLAALPDVNLYTDLTLSI